jgi:prepilin-type processing-associated H-X9-DG protein
MSNSDGEPGTQQLYPGSWWAHQIQPYVEIKRTRAGSKQGILRCPADNGPEYYYVNAGDGLEWIIGARLYAPEDPILQKRILDQRAREGRTELHIEPISYGGSCDAKGTDVWYRDRLGKLVPLYETPPKLVNIVKPYCLGVLTDGLDGSDNPNCFRWALLVGAGQRRDFFMRHFGGEDPRNNGVNWLFADGHVQWHSAAYTSSRLVCCLADFGIARDNEKALIDSHCGR